MADSKQKAGSPDRDRINVNEDFELSDWATRFGVSPNEVKAAVKAVGDNARRVEEFLSAHRTTKQTHT